MNFVDAITNKNDVKKVIKHYKDKIKNSRTPKQKTRNIRNFMIFYFPIHTGLRAGDFLILKVNQVKNKNGFKIKERKTKKTNDVEIPPNLKRELKKYVKGMNNNEYLFKSQKGFNKPLTTQQAYRITKESVEMVLNNINIGMHSPRKTWATRMLNNEKDMRIVSKALNHCNEATSYTYTGIVDKKVKKAKRKISYE